MLLSGIKTGKRKRPVADATGAPSICDRDTATAPAPAAVAAAAVTAGGGGDDGNQSAAEALRRSLLQHDDDNISKNYSNPSSDKSDVLRGLQSRGRISNDVVPSSSRADTETIVIHTTTAAAAAAAAGSTIQYEHEHNIRYNSRGKLSRHAHDQLRQKTDRDISVHEMLTQERASTNNNDDTNNNMDDIYLRNVMRMGSKGYKKLEKSMGMNNSRSGADEDDYLQNDTALHNLYRSKNDTLSPAELASRSQSRQIAHHDALSKWTAKSWWWMESPSFDKKYLIALGEKVSLVMTPGHKRLVQSHLSTRKGGGSSSDSGVWEGGQCYIVPLGFSESFVALDEDAWYEVKRFQSALRRMFLKEGRGVIFLETLLRTTRSASGGGGGMALQAKMDVIPVPLSVERDAPLYFRSALAEVAQEWGTHGLKPIALDGKKKTLRNAVPKIGFPYFYCGWGNNADEGYVQLIENEDDGDDVGEDGGGYGGGGGMRGGGGSKRFTRDFGIDIIGGMMDCDPIRFQRKGPSSEDGDRREVLRFCEKWKEFDWTLELDE